MARSAAVVGAADGVEANQVWLWGQGQLPEAANRSAPATALRRGWSPPSTSCGASGCSPAWTSSRSRAPPAGTTPTTRASGTPRSRYLADGGDLFVIHVEASDEAGHAGDVEEKIRALENWDRRILAGLVEGLDALGPWRLLLLPDHATPIRLRTHTHDPVPYLLVDSAERGPGGCYTEADTATLPRGGRPRADGPPGRRVDVPA